MAVCHRAVGKVDATSLTSRTAVELVVFGILAMVTCEAIALRHRSDVRTSDRSTLRCLHVSVSVYAWVRAPSEETDGG